MKPELKLFKKFIRLDGNSFSCHYAHNESRASDGRECVTIYAKIGFPQGKFGDLEGYRNGTDLMSDYFDKGKVDIFPENELFEKALSFCS